MNKLDHYQYCCDTYKLMYCKVTGNMNYSFNHNDRDKKVIQNFLKTIDVEYSLNNIGKQFLFQYISFAFCQRYDQKTRFGKGVVYVNHVFGAKQFEAWKNRPEEYMYHIGNFCDLFRIKFPVLIENKINYDLLSLEEEEIKKMKLNSTEGLLNCIDLTTLYSPKSINCRLCKYRNDCKELLKSTYPSIYSLRFS